MAQLSFIEDEKTYRGFTTEQYKQAILDYSDAMFKLFDSDRKYASGNLGMHIMWLGSWTTKFIAREVVDYAIEHGCKLNVALVEVLINTENNPYGSSDLEKIKLLLK